MRSHSKLPHKSPARGALLEYPNLSSQAVEYPTVQPQSIKIYVNGMPAEDLKDFLVGNRQPPFRVEIVNPWEGALIRAIVTPSGDHSGVVSPPNFLVRNGHFDFTPDVTHCRPTDGSRAKNLPIAYLIEVYVNLVSGKEVRVAARIAQDAISTLRQEYLDYEQYRDEKTPARGQFGIGPTMTNFKSEEFVRYSNYEVSLNQGMHALAQNTRDKYGAGIIIGSGFRNPQRNKIVGGHRNSKHMLGMAVDMTPADNTAANMFLMYVASLDAGGGLSLLEKGARQLMRGNHRPGAATWEEIQAKNLVLRNVSLSGRQVNRDRTVSFFMSRTKTMPIKGHTTFSQEINGKLVTATVKDVVYRGQPPKGSDGPKLKQDKVTFPAGTELKNDQKTELATPYSVLFDVASHVHIQTS